MEVRPGLVKPPGRWLLTVTSDDEGEAWVAEDLNGAAQGGAAPTLAPTLHLLEAAERRLALAKLAQKRLSPAFLTWDPDIEEKVGRMIVGVTLDPWPAIEDSEDSEADEDDLAQRTCIREDQNDTHNAEADVRNARVKLLNPCRCYQCLIRQLAVAIDIGPKFTGVGFSTISHDMAIFPSAVAQPAPEMLPDREPEPESEAVGVSSISEGVPGRSEMSGESSVLEGDPGKGENLAALVVGDAALALPSVRRPLNALVPPLKGLGMDWSALEAVWRHSYTNVLCVDPSDHALLMTEPPVNAVATRERLTTLAFTTFRVPSFYLCNTSALTLYSTGKLTGIVVVIDSSGIAASAVYAGYLLPHSMQYSDIGGDAIGRCLAPALERTGCVFANPIEKMDCISDLVKAMAVVPIEKGHASSDTVLQAERCVEVRRGRNGGQTRVRATAAERLACGEALFDPSALGADNRLVGGGLADTIFQSISATDIDTCSRELWKAIVVCGEFSTLTNLNERLARDVQVLTEAASVPFRKPTVLGHKLPALVGAQILASLSTFGSMWISAAEYEETGASIIGVKCF